MIKTPAGNERFHASGGVCPHKHLCKFATASPAATLNASGQQRSKNTTTQDN